MKYISVVVVGSRYEAASAAAERGIPAAFQNENFSIVGDPKTVYSTIKVGPQFHAKIGKWYAEDAQRTAPFPTGSILIYSFHE